MPSEELRLSDDEVIDILITALKRIALLEKQPTFSKELAIGWVLEARDIARAALEKVGAR